MKRVAQLLASVAIMGIMQLALAPVGALASYLPVLPPATGQFGTVISTSSAVTSGYHWDDPATPGIDERDQPEHYISSTPSINATWGNALDYHWLRVSGQEASEEYIVWDFGFPTAGIRVYPAQSRSGSYSETDFDTYEVWASIDNTSWNLCIQSSVHIGDINAVRTHDGVKDYPGYGYRYFKIRPLGVGYQFTVDAVEALYPVVSQPPISTTHWSRPRDPDVVSVVSLIGGDSDTYTVDTAYQIRRAGVTSMAAAGLNGGGRVIVTSSMEGFESEDPTIPLNFGYDGDALPAIDEYDNTLMFHLGVDWLTAYRPAGQTKKVLFLGGGGISTVRATQHLTEWGYAVTESMSLGGGYPTPVTLADLQNFDLIILGCSALLQAANSAEAGVTADAFVDFVKSGKGLWILGHYNGPHPITLQFCFTSCDGNYQNQIANRFGIDFNMDTVFDPTNFDGFPQNVVYHNFTPHALTAGLGAVSFKAGSSLSISPGGPGPDGWYVSSVEPAGRSCVDWLAPQQAPAATGNYLMINGLYYYVFNSGVGSWSGPGLNYACLGNVDPATGNPLPLPADLSGTEGRGITLFTSWPPGNSDTTPEPFEFFSQAGVSQNTLLFSNTITVTGINSPAPIAISACSSTFCAYSINGWASNQYPGTVSNGDTVRLLQTSAATYSTTSSATVAIGGISGTFSATTLALPSDGTPDQFILDDQNDVPLNAQVTSNMIMVTGINVPAPISISFCSGVLCEYAIGGGPFTSDPGTVNNGDTVVVRETSAGSGAATTDLTLNIGGVSDTFSITTAADTTPPTGFIRINNGAAYTTSPAVALILSAADAGGVVQMQFSEDGVAWTAPEPYAPSRNWALSPGDGTKTVYVRYQDAAGNWSAETAISDTILLETTPPVVVSTDPVAGATGVPLDKKISATFSEDMDPATITPGSFTVSRFVGIKAVAAGEFHTVALKNDGTVVAWGYDGRGQSLVPSGLSGVTAVSAGSWHTLALKGDGTVAAWGDNWSGVGTVPPDLSGVSAVAAGAWHSLALRTGGTVVAWGDNSYGQSSVPDGLVGVRAIAAGWYHTLALKDDGTLVPWGSNSQGQCAVPPDLSGVTAIAVGEWHSVALKDDGTLVAWGDNSSGQTAVPPDLSGVTAIAAGFRHTVALKDNGTVVAWGRNDSGQTTVPAGLSGVIAIAAGGDHTAALKNDGTVVAWGDNHSGQSTVPAGLSGVASIAGGVGHYLALRNDGTVMSQGYNYYGQTVVPEGLAGVAAVAAGIEHSVALKNDGTVVAWGWNYNGQTAVPPGLYGVKAIAAGWNHTVALKNDGTVVAWGDNTSGQTITSGLTGVKAIAAGAQHTVALKNDGTVVERGIEVLSGAKAVAAGDNHTVALMNDGTVVAWGENENGNEFGQTTVPADLSEVRAVAAGHGHTVALKNDGTVVAWGWTFYGQTTVPAGLSEVIAVGAGWEYTLALKKDGTLVAWGDHPPIFPLGPYETALEGTVVYDAGSRTAAFTPLSPLEPGITYFATVNIGARSAAGVPLAADVRWSFTTVGAPQDCVVGDWGPWGDCSALCGEGVRTRTRPVIIPPANGGAACPNQIESESCNTQPCTVTVPNVVGMLEATAGVAISGAGLALGTVTTQNSDTVPAGKVISQNPIAGTFATPGSAVDLIVSLGARPVDCVLSAWSDWGACSVPCGGGTQTSTRQIITPPSNGGAACPTDLSRSQSCNPDPCPVDVTVTMTASDPSAGEPADRGTLAVIRTGATTASLTASYTVGGSAVSGLDYWALRGTVTIPAGATTANILVTPINDFLVEPAEDVIVTLSASPTYLVGTPATATVTIADNDTRVSIQATDPLAAEFGADSGTFTVTREGYSQTALTVAYTVAGAATPSGGGADGDYNALSGTVTIPANQTTATITVTPINDTDAEPNETVIVSLVAQAYTVAYPSRATVTILDNDTSVKIVATDPSAGEPADPGTFTLTRTGWISGSMTVAYTVSGSATGGWDYLALRRSVTFPAGASMATILVTPIDDAIVEEAEDVIVTLSASPAYTLGTPTSATVTIADNDTRVSIAATDPIAAESGADSGTFTVTRTVPATTDLVVVYTVAGAATPSGGTGAGDYSALSGTVTIPAGETTATITVTPIDDTVAEPMETVTVALVAKNYTVAHPSRATVTILDNDTTVAIAATDPSAGEPSDRGSFTLTRTGWINGSLTVAYTVSGSATDGLDYRALRGNVNFPAGASTAEIVVHPSDDLSAEPAEDVVVTLSASPAYTLGTPASATVTIADNDTRVSIAATDPIAAEFGADSGTFTVTRVGYTVTDLIVTYSVAGSATPSGGGAAGDYTALSGTLIIPAGETSATITVTPLDDASAEPKETVIVSLIAKAYTVAHPTRATVTILDNDTTVSIAATDPSAGEPSDRGTFTLTRTGWIDGPLTVAYTVGGSATGGLDYLALPAMVTFPAGAAMATIVVNPINDGLVEPAEEVVVSLSASPAYTLGTASSATVTIADNDTKVSLAATDPIAAESGADSGTFTVTREGYTLSALTVAYTVAGTATPSGGDTDGDYNALLGTVTIPAGETTATFTVTPIDDTRAEPNETVIVRLVPQAYTVGYPSSATMTILDNDTTVSIAATDPNAGEPNDRGTFTLTRTGLISGSLTVAYTVSGSASAGLDYLALRGNVTFPPGAATATILVIPINDLGAEPAEDVIVTLNVSPAYTLEAPSTATVTIADNDSTVITAVRP